ncbi:flavodoxin domain-containing protein [Spiribacter halobius]|uniref:Flavodoxin-like domain-containing protein n=1 Tax=Sediminicurvatus halobius TaxID=2182432 RepID=A0A2U2MVR5_9GAMM|nr:flavodoxin domain-containing protein [Spiribacter halobius]PWG60949.1 hypothetical protein DEM34_18965 [Spiribacter halobius]UEX76618.1 flavodoxin domain-containing protein [Spiribacter halobius]
MTARGSHAPAERNTKGDILQVVLAGLPGQRLPATDAGPEADPPPRRLTIVYGSETGTAEELAERAGELATAWGLFVRVRDMADCGVESLRAEPFLMVITATYGDGEPPNAATDLHERLHEPDAPRLDGVRFAVLALGDSCYRQFCQAGRDFDARLAELGAARLVPRMDCDADSEADFEENAEHWIDSALERFAEHAGVAAPARCT